MGFIMYIAISIALLKIAMVQAYNYDASCICERKFRHLSDVRVKFMLRDGSGAAAT